MGDATFGPIMLSSVHSLEHTYFEGFVIRDQGMHEYAGVSTYARTCVGMYTCKNSCGVFIDV